MVSARSLTLCARGEPLAMRRHARAARAVLPPLRMPVDNLRERLVVVEIRILLVCVAGETHVRTHDCGWVALLRMFGAHTVAILALHVHELAGARLGRARARLTAP